MSKTDKRRVSPIDRNPTRTNRIPVQQSVLPCFEREKRSNGGTDYRPERPDQFGLIVAGDLVSRDQAEEIIIRTSDPFLFRVHDPESQRLIDEAFQIRRAVLPTNDTATGRSGTDELTDEIRSLDEIRDRYQILPLQLFKNHRIAAIDEDGPRGWMDWNGRIGCASYNLPPTPGILDEEIIAEAMLIAQAFPYLRMVITLVGSEDHTRKHAYLRMVVKDGTVQIAKKHPPDWHGTTDKLLAAFNSDTEPEVGCVLDHLSDVLGRVSDVLERRREDPTVNRESGTPADGMGIDRGAWFS